MIKNIINTIKLIKYSPNCLLNLLLIVVFFLSGLYLISVENYSILGCSFLMLSGIISAQVINSIALSEHVAASPSGTSLKKRIPHFILIFSTIFTYITLVITTLLKASPSSRYYSFNNVYDVIDYILPGIYVLLLVVLLLPLIYRHLFIGVSLTIIIYAFSSLIFSSLFRRLGYYEESPIFEFCFNLGITKTFLYSFLIIAFILILTTSVGPFHKYMWQGIKLTKNNKIYVAIMFISLLVISGFTISSASKYIKKNNTDGMYNYSQLHTNYHKLATDINEEITVGSFEITLEKLYYDADTMDAYALIQYKAPADSNLIDFVSISNGGYFIITADKNTTAYSSFNHAYVKTMINGSGAIDVDYSIDLDEPNIAHISVYMNMLPSKENEALSISFFRGSGDKQTIYFGDNAKNVTITNDNMNFIISPTSIICSDYISPSNLSLITDNGKEIKIVKDSCITKKYEKYATAYSTKYIFPEVIDINDIKEIKITHNNESTSFIEDSNVAIYENDYMRKTITYTTHNVDDNNVRINGSLTVEWTKMPSIRNIDEIFIKHNDYVEYTNKGIVQSVWKETNETNKELISYHYNNYNKVIFRYDEEDPESFGPPELEPSTFYCDIMNNMFHIFPKIYNDSKDTEYSNQQVTHDFTYLIEKNATTALNPPFIELAYKHFVTKAKNHDETNNSDKFGLVGRPIFHRFYIE
ncbi:MAG: hypothetical protein J6L69_08945 [Lachnospiraceae bacterium]|nr:hypothetical protein [Lachnospiraceae bacterium]